MKITCEHCGSAIDTDNDKKCPNCGAPYSNNKEYKDNKRKKADYDFREREAEIRTKELSNKIIEKTLDVQKNFKIFPIIFFIIFIVAIVFIIYTMISMHN